jgi:hypothetical protein
MNQVSVSLPLDGGGGNGKQAGFQLTPVMRKSIRGKIFFTEISSCHHKDIIYWFNALPQTSFVGGAPRPYGYPAAANLGRGNPAPRVRAKRKAASRLDFIFNPSIKINSR